MDTLPFGVSVANPPNVQASSGCDADFVVATAGSGTVTIQTGAPIPVGGCSISVDVTSSVENEIGHENLIPVGALETDVGSNTAAATANLKVSPLGITKEDGGTGPYAIGDEIDYTVSITVPAALGSLDPVVVNDLTLIDALPDGLEYLTGNLRAEPKRESGLQRALAGRLHRRLATT